MSFKLEGGVGKTTLARKYLQQEFASFLEFPIAKETKDIASIESLIEEKLRQLGEEPGREFFVSLDRLKRKLQDERIGILIDNLEPALDSAGKFIEPHRRYVELLRVLTDPAVQSVTFITSRERLRESSITIEHYMLRSLDIEAWEQFFQSRNLATDTSAFAALHNVYGGNAKAMDIIRGAILEDYSGDIAAYWQANQHDLFIERDLEDLVTQQFDRLQQIDPDAYNLLCRMGCYRYQDVPTVPIEGLFCLLWDVPENRQRRVVKSLQERSLVEFVEGEFWLHPIIREETIKRLRGGEEWKTANQIAAEFWAESVRVVETVEEAIKSLEAYYHYIEISDFEQAAHIINRETRNTWRIYENLGLAFCRLGLLQQMIFVINKIINNISPGYSSSRLCETLADLYILQGFSERALALYKRANCIANEALRSLEESAPLELKIKLKSRSLAYHLNVGLYMLSVGEPDKALSALEESNASYESFIKELEALCETRENSEFVDEFINLKRSDYLYGLCCTAYTHSCLDKRREALALADRCYREISKTGHNSWTKGFGLIYIGLTYANLDKLEIVSAICNEAIGYAEEVQCMQVKALALTCVAETLRKQQEFKAAITYHLESLDLLEKTTAKCDLAQANYQLGLTYQAMGEIKKSNESFQKAILLFSEIDAPKRVERVKRSMEN